MTVQTVIAFLSLHRFSIVLVTSFCQCVSMWWQRRKLKRWSRWYKYQQQAQQPSHYQPQQTYRQY